jgi:hypothetical protein
MQIHRGDEGLRLYSWLHNTRHWRYRGGSSSPLLDANEARSRTDYHRRRAADHSFAFLHKRPFTQILREVRQENR